MLKILFVLLCVISYSSFSIGVGTVNAGGIPQFDHNTGLNNLNYSDQGVNCSANYANCGYWYTSPYYYHVIGQYDSFSLGNNYFFHGNIALGLYAGSAAYGVIVQGSADGANWDTLVNGRYNNVPYSANWTYVIGPMYRYIRAIGYTQYPNGGSQTYFNNWYVDYASADLYLLAADQATAQGALDASNAANSAAQNASTQASNAATYATQAVNWLNGTWGGYNLGTIGANAVAANSNAANAATQASSAYNQGVTTNNYLTDGINGLTAIKNQTTNAFNQGITTNNLLTDGTNGLSVIKSQTTSAYNESLSNNSELTNSSYGLNAINANINNTNTSVTNLQNNIAYLIPPVLTKVYGYNGATATSTTSFKVSMNYSGANEYQYQLDGGSWSGWTSLSSYNSSGYFTVGGISSTGIHTVLIQLRNNNGSGIVSQSVSGEVTFFKL